MRMLTPPACVRGREGAGAGHPDRRRDPQDAGRLYAASATPLKPLVANAEDKAELNRLYGAIKDIESQAVATTQTIVKMLDGGDATGGQHPSCPRSTKHQTRSTPDRPKSPPATPTCPCAPNSRPSSLQQTGLIHDAVRWSVRSWRPWTTSSPG